MHRRLHLADSRVGHAAARDNLGRSQARGQGQQGLKYLLVRLNLQHEDIAQFLTAQNQPVQGYQR